MTSRKKPIVKEIKENKIGSLYFYVLNMSGVSTKRLIKEPHSFNKAITIVFPFHFNRKNGRFDDKI